MKLNLGCGPDVRPGYENVDLRPIPNPIAPVTAVDLSKLPWPWPDESVEEVLMLDFLEHFPYNKTMAILSEVWRILAPGGFVDVQVPDFEHCARAMIGIPPYDCNKCGFTFHSEKSGGFCPDCKSNFFDIADAAMKRLYGGQDYEGNWHFTAFTNKTLPHVMHKAGFGPFQFLEQHHQYKNWNFKVRCYKRADAWTE